MRLLVCVVSLGCSEDTALRTVRAASGLSFRPVFASLLLEKSQCWLLSAPSPVLAYAGNIEPERKRESKPLSREEYRRFTGTACWEDGQGGAAFGGRENSVADKHMSK